MARKQSPLSKLLEALMNTQCFGMNIFEKQRTREMIDEADDRRREEYRKGMKERFLDMYEALENGDCYKAKKNLIKLESYFNKEVEKEDYYEKLDDDNRDNIIEYIVKNIEEIRDYNKEVEQELLKK